MSSATVSIADNDSSTVDTRPDAFNFKDLTGVRGRTQITSSTVKISGLSNGTKTRIQITRQSGGDASYSINGGPYRKGVAMVKNRDKIKLRNRIPTPSGAAAVTVTIGGISDEWTITTRR
ncbi:MAG: hypothetical protein ACT4QA_03810 [Panacagrimonas sp.]